MKSLRYKSLWQFIGCIIVVLFLTAPLFYLLTENFYAEDIISVVMSIHKGRPMPALDLKSDIMIGMMIQFTLIFLVLSLSFIITMRFITKRIWSPFYDTLQKIKQFNLEQNKVPDFVHTNINEFVQLEKAASQLIHKDMESYKMQREFTENASHELQTPLAVFQSKLDLLMQENLTEKQMKIVSELYSVNSRLNKLNKNLLLLTKIENKQYSQMEKIHIVPYLKKNLSLYKDLYNKPIQFTNLKNEDLVITANASLFDSLFNNLLVNAVRHSTPESTIEICINKNTLAISNESNGEKLDEKRLFQRFNNNNGKNRGNGLGLAIVKAICDYHGWKIKYSFENNKHHFSIIFH